MPESSSTAPSRIREVTELIVPGGYDVAQVSELQLPLLLVAGFVRERSSEETERVTRDRLQVGVVRVAGIVTCGMLGDDPIAELRGTYDSDVSARRVMVARGWRSLGDVAGHYFEEIPRAHARTGDWALIINPNGTETIGVFSRERVVAKTEGGMGSVPRGRATRAFRVST